MYSSSKRKKESRGTKTTNTAATLEILKDVGKIAEKVPYLEPLAGILKTIVTMKQEFDACEEAWEEALEKLKGVKDVIVEFHGQHPASENLPDHLKKGCDLVLASLKDFEGALCEYQQEPKWKRVISRRALKDAALQCGRKLDNAIQQHDLIVTGGMAIQVDAIYQRIDAYKVPPVAVNLASFICRAPSEYFTGRGQLLEDLQACFVVGERRIATLTTHGGAGKTQVALKYADLSESKYGNNIFFIDASSEATIVAAYKSVAAKAALPQTIEGALEFFYAMSTPFLLILDNADDTTLNLSPFLPPKRAHILITSRNTAVNKHASPRCAFKLSDLDEEEAIVLLLKRAGLQMTPEHVDLAKPVVLSLGCMALAVTIAGGTIETGMCTLEQYNTKFGARILEEEDTQSFDGYTRTLWAAFKISFDSLHERAQQFVKMLSRFHYTDVPISVFSTATVALDDDQLLPGEIDPSPEARTGLRGFLSAYRKDDGGWDERHFLKDILTELQHRSLISYNAGTNLLSMHLLVHGCARKAADSSPYLDIGHLCLVAFGAGETAKDEVASIKMVQHVLSVPLTLSHIPSLTSFICRTVGDLLWAAGSTHCQLELWTHATELDHLHYGEYHHLATINEANLAGAHHMWGQFAKAEELLVKVVASQQEVLGLRHPGTLTAIDNLARTHQELGHYAEAEKLEVEVLDIRRQVLGPHHLDTLRVMSNLAHTRTMLGQYAEAEKLMVEVLDVRREVLGLHHPSTLLAMAYLARTRANLGRHTEAEKLKVEVLDSQREVLGLHHPDTLSSMASLAITYGEMGQHVEAEKLEVEVLDARREVLGPRHPKTLTAMNNLALTQANLGRHVEAEKLEVEVLDVWKQVLGPHHPDTLLAMANLARTQAVLGRHAEAEKLEVEVLDVRREVLGLRHPATIRAMVHLSVTLYNMNRYAEAEQMEVEVLRLCTEILGEGHPDTQRAQESLAMTRHHLDSEKSVHHV